MTARSPMTWWRTRRRPKTTSFWYRKSWSKPAFSREAGAGSRQENASNSQATGCPMCLLCDDEKAYQAYMNYLDAMERQGKTADPHQAVDPVLDALEAGDKASNKMLRDDPANDQTPSPFVCSPVDNLPLC